MPRRGDEISAHFSLTTAGDVPFACEMSNCQESSGVSPDATENDNDLCPRKWPHTRRALLVARLDEELDKMPRREWFDRALQAHLLEEVNR